MVSNSHVIPPFLEWLGFSEEKRKLITALCTQDHMGEYLQGTEIAEKSVKNMLREANNIGVEATAYYDLVTRLYRADAGSFKEIISDESEKVVYNQKNTQSDIERIIETVKKSPNYCDLPEDAFAQAEASFHKAKMEMYEKDAKEKGMEVEEYINKIDENAKRMFLSKNTKICIRILNAQMFINIIRSEFKTIHEIDIAVKKTPKYANYLVRRLAAEQIMHNQDPKKTEPHTYRVSAYVTNQEDGEGAHSLSEKMLRARFGEIAIILKDKVKERTWVGCDDILEQVRFVDKDGGESGVYKEERTIKKTMKLVPFLHPNSDAFAWKIMDSDERQYLWHDKPQSPLEYETLADIPSFYTEAHIARNETTSSGESRKPLGADDMERVIFRGRDLGIIDNQGRCDPQLLKELMIELSEHGIAWSVRKGLSLKDVFGEYADVAERYSQNY
jgi:hypothetical protein